ncbi:MAG TPA: hypothetical protein GX702_15710 [Chloroflexi bacterium]|nr:hypothetical protein [Chloroflexota bacterium]
MNRRRLILLVATLLLSILWGGCSSPSEGRVQRAAVVVQYGNGDYIVRVVEFREETITGMDLLRRNGFDVLEKNGFVCRIDAEGCELTACPCMGDYWSYWQAQDGDWAYSSTGAAGRRVTDGMVEAWVWGDGSQPPRIGPDEVWADPAAIGRAWPFGVLVARADDAPYPAPHEEEDTPGWAYPAPDEEDVALVSTPDDLIDPTPDPVTPPTLPPEQSISTPAPVPTDDTAPGEIEDAPAATVEMPVTPTTVPDMVPLLTPSPTGVGDPATSAIMAVVAARIATAVAEDRAAAMPVIMQSESGRGIGKTVARIAAVGLLLAILGYGGLLYRQRQRARSASGEPVVGGRRMGR